MDNSLFVVFSYVHLKQKSHRKAIKSFIQSHISVFSKWSGGAVVPDVDEILSQRAIKPNDRQTSIILSADID